MSQVIVTHDVLSEKRARSRQQEQKISREEAWAHWRRSDVTKYGIVTRLIGYLSVPVVALWTGMILAPMAIVLNLLRYLFRAIGALLGGPRSLITGK